MNVADEVKAVIARKLKISSEELNDARQLGDLGADSFDVIEIVFALEEKFDIDITDEIAQIGRSADKPQRQGELSILMTVGDFCGAVQAVIDAKASK
jgi:acyl carrier protein